jgi:hypothetical protein
MLPAPNCMLAPLRLRLHPAPAVSRPRPSPRDRAQLLHLCPIAAATQGPPKAVAGARRTEHGQRPRPPSQDHTYYLLRLTAAAVTPSPTSIYPLHFFNLIDLEALFWFLCWFVFRVVDLCSNFSLNSWFCDYMNYSSVPSVRTGTEPKRTDRMALSSVLTF